MPDSEAMPGSKTISERNGHMTPDPKKRELYFVRPARLEEADEIHALVIESMSIYCKSSNVQKGMLDAASESAEDVRSAIKSVPFLVAVDSRGSLLGSVRLPFKMVSSFAEPDLSKALSLGSAAYVTYFSRFAVRGDHHGHGVGSLLFTAAQKAAVELKSPWMLLHTSLYNENNVAFYEKRGFVLLLEDASRGYPRGLFGIDLRQQNQSML